MDDSSRTVVYFEGDIVRNGFLGKEAVKMLKEEKERKVVKYQDCSCNCGCEGDCDCDCDCNCEKEGHKSQ